MSDIRYAHVKFDEEHGGLPIEEWHLIQEPCLAFRFDRRWDYTPRFTAVAYAKEYSWVAPKLWLRERPGLVLFNSAMTAVTAVGIALGVLVDPLALFLCVAGVTLAAAATIISVDLDVALRKGCSVSLDRRRPVVRVSGFDTPQILAAYEHDADATMASLRVLAKGKGVASDEALDLAAEIIGRLAKSQRELEEDERVRKEAEATALAEFTAAAEIEPIVDRSDEIALSQLSAELELQGK